MRNKQPHRERCARAPPRSPPIVILDRATRRILLSQNGCLFRAVRTPLTQTQYYPGGIQREGVVGSGNRVTAVYFALTGPLRRGVSQAASVWAPPRVLCVREALLGLATPWVDQPVEEWWAAT